MRLLSLSMSIALIGFTTTGLVMTPAQSKPIKGSVVVSSLAGSTNQQTLAQARGVAPPITTVSSAAEIALARHLKKVGAKMYGAYWCPHCHDQMRLFGQQAAQQAPYIECAQDGKNTQYNLCKKIGIRGFPTWKIKGKTYEGTQSLDQLANASGFRGAHKFKNSL